MFAIAFTLLAACGDQDAASSSADAASGQGASADGRPAREERPSGRSSRRDADKGSASMHIGESDWSANRATARLREGKLRIGANHTQRIGSKMQTESLTLVVEDYAGPGEYTTAAMSSSFTRVAFDVDKAKAAGEDDAATAATAAVAMESLSTADHVSRIQARLTVTAATDEFIDGTFEWAPAGGGTPIREGRFHAQVRR
ncbi:MAG TPA: hypothetical protein VFG21_03115 [Xanthomonadaceae bacterium]|nr:hypothetical protein [Xanthomonadaceae bacterium]